MTEDGSDGESLPPGEQSGRPDLAERRDVPDVYPPAEDSDLLARTVAEEVELGDRALDVGTGTGYVAAMLQAEGADVVGVDVSPLACATAAENGVPVVRGDMVSPFRESAFDVVACNPPYLPTPPDREWDDWMERALSGGPDGRAMVDPFLESVGPVLGSGGRAYLLISSLTGIEDVVAYAVECGLAATEVASEDHPYERLVVLRLEPA